MGEAKKRGNRDDRIRQANEAAELTRIMEKRRIDAKIKAELDAFAKLSPEEQKIKMLAVEEENERRRRLRMMLTSIAGIATSSGLMTRGRW